jgi:hypothetical protein
MQAEDNVRSGMEPSRAIPAARRSFGGVEQVKERYRDLRGLPILEALIQDLNHGWRLLWKNPGFTFVAVVSLAIGVGANAATFSLADALLLRPLPVPRPHEVVTVGSLNVTDGSSADPLQASYPDYVDLRDRNDSFAELTASDETPVLFVPQPGSAPEVRMAAVVSGNSFAAMGVDPTLGRAFVPDEDRVPLRDAVVVLSHAFWERQFGARPDVLGLRVRLNGTDFAIVGVAPPAFTGINHYGVSRRTREIGIRMAVGATEGVILRMVLKQGLSLAAIGIVIGLILTLGADRAMQAAFPGGSGGQRGAAEYVMMTALLLAITSFATYLPARRAARLEPTIALRQE